MIYALDTDNGALLALPSAAEAEAHCKPVDVRDGYWLFFTEDGKPLDARFSPGGPDGPAAAPAYTLQQALSGRWLQERIGQITKVQGCGITSIAQLVETWNKDPRKPAAR